MSSFIKSRENVNLQTEEEPFMPILNLNHVSLYYEEFGQGDRYLIQAQQFVNSHIYYT